MASTDNQVWNIDLLCEVNHSICGIAVDSNGTIYFSQKMKGVWKLDKSQIQSLPGTEGIKYLSFDGDCNLFMAVSSGKIHKWDIKSNKMCSVVEYLQRVASILFDHCMLYALEISNVESKIRKIDPDDGAVGVLFNFYALHKKPIPFKDFTLINFDQSASIFAIDKTGNCIRTNTDDVIGSGQRGHKDGDFKECMLCHPRAIVKYHDGSLLVLDQGNNAIRKIDLKRRRVSTVLESRFLWNSCCMALDKDGILLIGDTLGRIHQLIPPFAWKIVKLVWIAKLKESPEECPLATLPKDIIKEIVEWLTGRIPAEVQPKQNDKKLEIPSTSKKPSRRKQRFKT